jgi:hypothetical protein
MAVDGVTLDAPDTSDNEAAFGQPASRGQTAAQRLDDSAQYCASSGFYADMTRRFGLTDDLELWRDICGEHRGAGERCRTDPADAL